MATAWIKNINFSDTKETFSEQQIIDDKEKAPYPPFLKSQPIKSVHIEQVDARNTIEPLDTIGGSGFDNIKGFQPAAVKKENKKQQQKNNFSPEKDIPIINDMLTTVAASLISLYLAYNLYFNLTVGGNKMFEIDSTLDKIPMKPATNWFVEIVKNINSFITISIPTRIRTFVDGNSYIKYRTIFVFFVVLSNFLLKPAMSNLVGFFTGLAKQTPKTIFKYISSPSNNNKIISVLFFFFLTKALYSLFLEQGTGPIVSFIVANPILFAIGLLIYVVVLYPITVPLSSFAVSCLLIFYCFFSMIYFYFTQKFDASSPYANVSSFSELFSSMNNHLNFGPVLFENQNNIFEKIFAFIFNDIYYVYFLGVLVSMIPLILKMQSTMLRMYIFILVGSLIGLCGAFKYYGVSELVNKIKNLFIFQS